MKRKIILLPALALSVVVLSLVAYDPAALAQTQIRFGADTGVVALGPNQKLRLSVAAGFDPGPLDGKFVRFRQIAYTPGACSGGACKHTIASQSTTDRIEMEADGAALFDIPAEITGGVSAGTRGVVLSSNRNVRVEAFIIDAITGEIVAFIPTGAVTF